MSKEIFIYRGETIESKQKKSEWKYGYYVYNANNKKHYIVTNEFNKDISTHYMNYYEVNPLSVSRYIGVNDDEGRKIFDDDFIEYTTKDAPNVSHYKLASEVEPHTLKYNMKTCKVMNSIYDCDKWLINKFVEKYMEIEERIVRE